jgi:hypothetical protein
MTARPHHLWPLKPCSTEVLTRVVASVETGGGFGADSEVATVKEALKALTPLQLPASSVPRLVPSAPAWHSRSPKADLSPNQDEAEHLICAKKSE